MSQLEEKRKTGILLDHFFSGMCECTNTRCFLLNMLGYCFCLARVTYEFIQQIKIQLTRVQRFVNTWYFAIRSCVCWVSECVCTCVCCVKISKTVFLNSALVARKNRNQTRSTYARDRSFHSTRHSGVRLIVRKFKLSNLLAPVQSFSLIHWFAFHTAKCVCVWQRWSWFDYSSVFCKRECTAHLFLYNWFSALFYCKFVVFILFIPGFFVYVLF